MNVDLSGKVVLVTGAAKGIGRATADAFAAAGATVVRNDLNFPDEPMWERPPGREPPECRYTADVSNKHQATTMIAAITRDLGPVDILVNNAGITLPGPFLDLGEDDWDRVLAVNLKSMFLTSQAVLPAMLQRGGGIIVNVASEIAYLGRAGFAPYAAAKGGVLSLTRCLAREFAPTIRVNAIAPGPVETDLLMSEIGSPEDLDRETAIPAGRLGRPEEISATAVFLASPQAAFYCGDTLSPSGGALMR